MALIYAHRGASAYAPENTLEAYRMAVEMGAEGIELDVHLSRDGEIVVIHDSTVDRTTNGSGSVPNFTLQELKELDASNGIEDYRGVKIPTLREVYELLQPFGTLVNVEIKSDESFYPGIRKSFWSWKRRWEWREESSILPLTIIPLPTCGSWTRM